MRIETAVKKLFEYHQKALMMNVDKKVIQDPVAWALYQTWREADRKGGKNVHMDESHSR